MLELRFLGRPLIVCDGVPVDGFVSDKALALFAYVVLNRGAHARQTLAGLLWGEMPEKRAMASLRVALHNLRQLFPDYLDVTRKQVAFVHEQPHQLDVAAFEQLATQSDDIEVLSRAATLYRGELLARVVVDGEPAFEEWLRAEQERLRLLLLQVLERLAEQYVAQGCWREAEQVTRRLLVLEPWSETSHRQLMLVLARQGEYGAALAQYEACQQMLQDELDVEPMAETQALQRRIRQLRTRPRHNLPTQAQPLLGREKELAQVGALLADNGVRLVTIGGLGGVGKTRLAVEVAARQVDFFLDGVYWVPLAGLHDASHLISHLITALGVGSLPGQEPRSRLLDFLRNKELLLVLDNFEQLLEGAALLKEILQAAPAVKLLVTSRERLKLQAEHLYPLSGLPYSAWRAPAEAEQDAAVQLFLHHARRVRPSFTLRAEHLPPLHDILQLTEGIPLALVLAASWIAVLGPAEIAVELDRSLDFLTATHRDVPARQRSMRAVFDATWQRLSQREQEIFAALSVFQGGFTLPAARAVANASPHDLMRLTDRSLLTRVQEGRFEVHELLRQFAATELARSANTEEAVRTHHSAYYLKALARHLPDLKGRDQLGALHAIEADFENVRAAWRRATEQGAWERIAQASGSLYLFSFFRSRYFDGIELFEAAHHTMSSLTTNSNTVLVRAYVLAGWKALLSHAGLHEEALAGIDALQEIVATLVDPGVTAFCKLMVGYTLMAGGHAAQSIEWLNAASTYYQQAQDPFYTALALLRLSWARYQVGHQIEEALVVQRRGLVLARQVGDRVVAAALLRSVGAGMWLLEGPSEASESYYKEAAQLSREMGEQALYAHTLSELANIPLWREGDLATTLPVLEEALAVATEQNLSQVRGHVLAELTTHRLVEGKYEEALALTEEVFALTAPHGDTRAWATFQRGIALLALGHLTDAVPSIKKSLSYMVQHNMPGFLRTFLPFAGMVLAEQGEHDRAAELLASGLTHPHASGRLEVDPLIARYHAELEDSLGPERFAAAWKRGKQLDALAAAAEVLVELGKRG